MLSLTSGALVEIFGSVLGSDHTDLKDQIFTVGSDTGDAPPPEKSPNVNAVKVGDSILHDLPSNLFRVGGQVIIRR